MYPDSAYSLAKLQLLEARNRNYFKGQSFALQVMGISHFLRGSIDSAIYFYETVVELTQINNDPIGTASAYHNLCGVYNNSGQFEKGIEMEEKSLAIKRQLGNEHGIAISLIGLSKNKNRLGFNLDAVKDLEASIEILCRLNDLHYIIYAYTEIGGIYADMGFPDSVKKYYTLAVSTAKHSKLEYELAGPLNDLGLMYCNQGNFAKAIEYYNQSKEIYSKLNDHRGLGAISNNLGVIHLNLGDFKKAREYYSHAAQLAFMMGDPNAEAIAKYNIACTYSFESNDSAIMVFKQALELYREIKHAEGISICLKSIGNYFISNGEYLRAIDSVRISLEIAGKSRERRLLGEANISMGSAYAMVGEFDSSIYYGRMASEIAEFLENRTLIQAVSKLLFRDYMAVKKFDNAGSEIGKLIRSTASDIRLNFPVLSEKEKEEFFDLIHEHYDLFYDYTLLQAKEHPVLLDSAFSLSLRLKGLLLKSSTAMRQSVLTSNDTVLIKNYLRWSDLKRQIARIYSSGGDAAEIESEAEILEKSLVEKIDAFSDLLRASTLSWRDVQYGLNAGEVAIEFIRFNHIQDYARDSIPVSIYCALVINNKCTHPSLFRLFEESELEKIIGTFPGNNLSYIDQVYGNKENTKSQLYDLIWKPMEKSLEGVKKVYVSPVGLLHKISFSALAKEQDVFLCDVHEIEMQSSTGNIAMKTADVKFDGTEQTTIFGGIDYNSDSSSSVVWNYLDGSLTETQKIEKILKKDGQNVSYYNLSSATEEQFKKTASQSNVLHIATHGFFYADPDEVMASAVDETESSSNLTFRGGTSGFGVHSFVKSRNPLMRSGLVFAGANDVWNRSTSTDDPMAIGFENTDSTYKEDGVLTAAEVATIDMRKTGLVVLSACETGLGDIKGSEGVYGLQRAFKMAGVKYIIMSLWQVPDKETAEFMTTFYKNLTKTNDIRKSFNLTQRTMREKYDPYYWGAFVLIE